MLCVYATLHVLTSPLYIVGWASTQVQAQQAGYAQPYAQPYDQTGMQDIGVKGRLINLISAVRTLMRSAFQISPLSHNAFTGFHSTIDIRQPSHNIIRTVLGPLNPTRGIVFGRNLSPALVKLQVFTHLTRHSNAHIPH